jgi:hypothetical protein
VEARYVFQNLNAGDLTLIPQMPTQKVHIHIATPTSYVVTVTTTSGSGYRMATEKESLLRFLRELLHPHLLFDMSVSSNTGSDNVFVIIYSSYL